MVRLRGRWLDGLNDIVVIMGVVIVVVISGMVVKAELELLELLKLILQLVVRRGTWREEGKD